MAAGKALLKKMDRAAQTPADMTTVARRGYIRSVYDDRAFQVCELFGAAHRAGVKLAPRRSRGLARRRPRVLRARLPRLRAHRVRQCHVTTVGLRLRERGATTSRRSPSAGRAHSVWRVRPGATARCPENAEVRALAPTIDVVLLSRTLSEVPDSWVDAVPCGSSGRRCRAARSSS